MTYTLRFLSELRYGSFVRWLKGTGEGIDEAGREATCIITISHPDLPDQATFYAKFYPDLGGRSRGIANEVAGYVLADRCGLPQPPRACILNVPIKRLDLASIDKKRHGWLKTLARNRTFYPAYCTQALNAQTPWHHYGKDAEAAMKGDVRAWPDHARTLAFDDIVANVDRHMNNLLRTGQSKYALIDHGRLAAADGHWKTENLNPASAFTNRLLDLLYSDPKDVTNQMIAEAEGAASALMGMHEVNHWCEALLKTPDERIAFDNFLKSRTISAPQRIAERYALC